MPKMSNINSMLEYVAGEMSIGDLKLLMGLTLTNTPGWISVLYLMSIPMFMSYIHILTLSRHGSDLAWVYCVVFIF